MTPVNKSPLQRYQQDIENNGFSNDEAQRRAMTALDQLYFRLLENENNSSNLLSRIFKKGNKPIKGLYMWGGVGRGKTYLMDTFFDALPIKKKKRMHFHRFMYWVHNELIQLAGKSDPLTLIANKLAAETTILCFDEFFVSDIGDAMILSTLLQEMFNLNMSLVATSNIVPDRLYWNGLQRTRFLPAIGLINKHTQVLNVDGGIDYRLRTLEQAEIYHSPLDQAAEDNLEFSFSNLAVDQILKDTTIIINDREIPVIAAADGIVWLNFSAACAGPRSSRDYIELSKLCHSVLLADVPQLDDEINDQVRRFISLVDEFYERHVKLIISAAMPLTEIYKGKELSFEFKRTISRLQEMQSHDYLAKEHIP